MSDPHDALFFATLSPHRSLTKRRARGLLCAATLVSTVLSVPFYLVGAWPVIGFLGLDVVALTVAFAASFRSARAREDIAVSALEVSIAKVSSRGHRREWRFNPVWVRLLRRDHEEFGLQALALASRGARVEIGSFLGPDDRATMAKSLTRALAEARRGPRFAP